MIKAGAQRLAAELGLMLVAPDTSPRGTDYPGPGRELGFRGRRRLLCRCHRGAVVHALAHGLLCHARAARDDRRASSPPIASGRASSAIPWAAMARWSRPCATPGSIARSPPSRRSRPPASAPGAIKAFTDYLGADRAAWADYDASELVRDAAVSGRDPDRPGAGRQIPRGAAAARISSKKPPRNSGQKLTLRRHPGYDHGYYFIQTFIEQHLNHHAAILCNKSRLSTGHGG